jgi:hypothetical protein
VSRASRTWGQATVAILVGVGLALVLGYGGIWPEASPGATNVQLQHSLLVWSAFPAGQKARPVVLSGSRVLTPVGGFPDKADRSEFSDGAIQEPASYPATPATDDGYRLISSQEAVTLMQSADATGPRLRITKITLGSSTFQTDRGPRVLPAWLVWFASVRYPAVVDANAIFKPAGVTSGGTSDIESASLATDKRTLTVTYSASAHPCDAYKLTVEESRTAVAMAPVFLHTSIPVCSAIRRSVIRLGAPLDGRVLIDGTTDQPITVLDAGTALGTAQPRQLLMSHRPVRRYPRVAHHRV